MLQLVHATLLGYAELVRVVATVATVLKAAVLVVSVANVFLICIKKAYVFIGLFCSLQN